MGTDVLRIVRYGAVLLIAALALVWIGVSTGMFDRTATSGGAPTFGSPLLPAFSLVDQTGASVSERDVLGRPSVVFFGFTYCPEVCPTTLTSMTSLLGKMGADADKLGVFFVTVDPERDTQAELKQYLASFDPRIRGLTGTADAIAVLAKPMGVYYARVPMEGGGYSIDHTASVFLLDAQGRFAGTIDYGEDSASALAKLQKLAGAPTS